jgi:type II secretory pathway pseudopilin PulG
LVVISIIALLLALLAPSLSRARQLALLSVCGSQLRNFLGGVLVYAQDNGGFFPKRDKAGDTRAPWKTWHNPPDKLFAAILIDEYGLAEENFWCPTSPQRLKTNFLGITGGKYKGFGYDYWVPRQVMSDWVPSIEPDDGRCLVADPDTVRGPWTMTDEFAARNPLFSDIAGTVGEDWHTIESLGDPPPTATLHWKTGHVYAGAVQGCNHGFADMHVERGSAGALEPVYRGSDGIYWH